MTSPANSSADQELGERPGVTAPAREGRRHHFLSDVLVARGLVSQEAMDSALTASRDGRRYTDILVSEGVLSDDDVALALAEHHGLEHVDLDAYPIDPQARALLPADTARRNGALPIAVQPSGEVVIAVHDPGQVNTVEVADLVRRPTRIVIASRTQIARRFAIGSDAAHSGQRAVRRAVSAPPLAPEARPAVVPPPASQPPAAVQAPAPAPAAVSPSAPAPPAAPFSRPSLTDAPGAPVPAPAERIVLRPREHPVPPAAVIAAPAVAPAAADAERLAELTARLARAEREAGDAQERARDAERAARDAEQRAVLAERRATGMVAAAEAANAALAQVAEARAIADDEAKARARTIESLTAELATLRAQLDVERDDRRRVEAELERLRPAAAPPAASAPMAHVVQPVAQPQPQPEPRPQPQPQPLAPRPALAPQPPPAARVAPRATPRNRKARGLRRMIAALRR